MMSHANLPVKMHYKLCKEAFNTAAKLDNLIAVDVDGKVITRYEYFGEPFPNLQRCLELGARLE